jgi:predicted nucleotidyltransferase/catechol 2,3-dioxygenase-like lactoylglutathione lyase family enzyme
MSIEGIDHIQLAMPAGGEDTARQFYADLLGIPEVPKPPDLAKRGGVWFENDKVKIHLGVDPEFRPARKAHPGLVVRRLRKLVARLRGTGVSVTEGNLPDGCYQVYVTDPFGNRLEFIEPASVTTTTHEISAFLARFAQWASVRTDIQAVALVGSHARNEATAESDVDLVIVADRPQSYFDIRDWVEQFGAVDREQVEHYGKVTSLRVWYKGGLEVEYGMTDQSWLSSPLDEGTRSVISTGMKVLFERGDVLSRHGSG